MLQGVVIEELYFRGLPSNIFPIFYGNYGTLQSWGFTVRLTSILILVGKNWRPHSKKQQSDIQRTWLGGEKGWFPTGLEFFQRARIDILIRICFSKPLLKKTLLLSLRQISLSGAARWTDQLYSSSQSFINSSLSKVQIETAITDLTDNSSILIIKKKKNQNSNRMWGNNP